MSNDVTIIAERINRIFHLTQKPVILVDDIDILFRPDLLQFIRGETLSSRDGKLSVGHNLYNRWIHKLRTRGFDYSIDFRQ
jgi:hypothetical protein